MHYVGRTAGTKRANIFLFLLFLYPIYGAAASKEFRAIPRVIHDGDALTLSTGQKIWLFGIDAPELNQQCNRNGECVPCGTESREALSALAVGELTCEQRGTSYDRIVARRIVGEIDLALELVKAGQAVVYRQYIKKGGSLRPLYFAAETEAKEAKAGIWGGAIHRAVRLAEPEGTVGVRALALPAGAQQGYRVLHHRLIYF